jgi:hypothetical protein
VSELQRQADRLKSLILRCEEATKGSESLSEEIEVALCIDWSTGCTTSIDGALELLPPGADWRRLTDRSASTYAANPYNAAAQLRHDGYGATVALQICSAALKVRLAPIEQKLVAQNRKVKAA